MNLLSGGKSQGKRIAKLSTPLGDDVLVASRLDGSEGMSQLFEYRIEGLSSDPDLDLDALIGRNSTMSLETPDLDTRHFDGIVVEAEWSGQRYDDHVYRMVLRPWFWLMSRRTDCRIFHEKTAPQIVEEVMKAHPFAVFENRLTRDYPKLEYTVQYRESDLAFCCRMMEKQGIGYYFRHEPGSHTLVMSDSLSSYETIPGGSRPFIPKAQREHVDGEHVYLMVPQRRFTSGRTRLNAYDFKKPSAMMATEAHGIGDYEHFGLERYDYPGKYVEPDAGTGYASAEMNAEAGRDRRRMVGGDLPSACPGQLMEVTGHPRGAENQDYLILSATHAFAAQGYRSGVNDEDAYHGTYELLPANSDYTPPQVTEKARVYGPQTAMVVGEGEIDVDEYGRILVRFHWDRLKDQSRRCRVSQNWASKGWGGMIIPRIGMEVIVDFLEGDPDEPIVTGCVYHAQNMPTYPLPANKTKSVFRTDTHQGQGFNELSFEDEKGREEIYMHAQRDQTIHVEHNRNKRIDNNQVNSIGNNKYSEVGSTFHEYIGGNYFLMIGGGEMQRLAGAKIKPLSTDLLTFASTLGISSSLKPDDGNFFTGVAKNDTKYVGLNAAEEVGRSKALSIGTSYIVAVGAGKSETVHGDSDETVEKRKLIRAKEKFEVRCGKARLIMKKDGSITIEGINVKVIGKRIDLN